MKMDTKNTNHIAGSKRKAGEIAGCHRNSDTNNKKEIQDGFSWWTNLMLGSDNPSSSQIIVKKVAEKQVEKPDTQTTKDHDDCRSKP